MIYLRNIALWLVAVVLSVMLTSCGEDFQGDIDKLNDQHTSIEKRISNLEEQVATLNSQLGHLAVLSQAVEQGFYITQVKTTSVGYELTLSNGRVIVLQNGADNVLTPMPAVSMTQIGGLYYWTLSGQLLTDADGKPIRTTGITPVVRYDYTLQQWVISIDGGVTFKNITELTSIVINDTVLMQVINSYVRQHQTTIISQEVLYQIISTYIQQNYKELFNVQILDEVVVNYVDKHYTRLFSYELLEKIFNQYNFSYYTSQIDVDVLINAMLDFIREHQEIFVNNEVLFEIISNYMEVNKTSIFTNQLLLEVINSFIENNENYINVEVLTQVVNNYIDQHQDIVFNTETIRTLLTEYVKKYYTQIFSQDILIQVINNYVVQNKTTIFNETLIQEVINNYLTNNFNTVISRETIYEIVNNYVKVHGTTAFNREVLIEVISNYFAKNYNLFIDRTTISTAINTYIEQHQTTLIDVDVIRQIVYKYLEQNYTEVFSYDMVNQVVANYFETHMQVITQHITEGSDLIHSVTVDNDVCTVTLSDGKTIRLVVYDALARLRDRVQSLVILPNANGHIDKASANGTLSMRYLVTPASMAQVIASKFQNDEVRVEAMVTDENQDVSSRSASQVVGSSDGVLQVSIFRPIYLGSGTPAEEIKTLALHIQEKKAGGTDIMTEFTPVDSEQQRGALDCPDPNHPHQINLGLPSGTLWSCCNVGTHAPEGYGTYHAWGETWTKSDYSYNSYTYKDYNTQWGMEDIGADIAGTYYDVASQQWGVVWHIPTDEQLKELINNTTSEWTTQGNVVGRKFTGSNGGHIFLPAAGATFYDSNGTQNYMGCYWSSTLSTEREQDSFMFANILLFTEQSAEVSGDTDMSFRFNGLTVRPVVASQPPLW